MEGVRLMTACQILIVVWAKGKFISSQFALEQKYCSLIVIGVPTRFKRFRGH